MIIYLYKFGKYSCGFLSVYNMYYVVSEINVIIWNILCSLCLFKPSRMLHSKGIKQ